MVRLIVMAPCEQCNKSYAEHLGNLLGHPYVGKSVEQVIKEAK